MNRRLAGVLLAVAWNFWSILAVNLLAIELGWWSFSTAAPSFMGVPLEPWLGWVLVWGGVAPLLGAERPLSVLVPLFLWADLLVMPLLDSIVTLGPHWLIGEAVALGLALVPGLLLARWTAGDTNLYRRAALQVICAGALMMWVIPSVAVEATGGWESALDVPTWQLSIGLQVLLVPVALGVRAVIEFATRGEGTPLPYDSPRRLVMSGPYSYVSNPMQTSMVLVFLIAAAVIGNTWLIAAAAMAFAYSAGLARWHETEQLSDRFGSDWIRYRELVHPWVPGWKPVVPRRATLLVAYSCGTCSSVGRWFLAREPIGLEIAPAEGSNDPGLLRVTYLPDDGPPFRGVAAIARALEHIHLGWAIVGWVLALPGVVHVAQAVADVCGPGPQLVAGRPYDKNACAGPRSVTR